MSDRILISLISLGCDKNLIDSELLLGSLAGRDEFAFTDDEETARVIIVNTCGFIKDAVDEAAEHISRAVELKEQGTCKTVAVTGCMVQRYGDKLLKDYPGIDILTPNTAEAAREILNFLGLAHNETKSGRALATPSHYAYLKIAEGCNNRCAYCAIPLIKGPYRSRPINEILDEAGELAKGGVKELIIVAQDTALYGQDLGGSKIPELLRRLSDIPGIEWLRLLYAYPEHITDMLIDEMRANSKICHYLDIPIQHASDGVLKRMGRKTDKAWLTELIRKLRDAMPDIILRTTVMTGFPGETKADFQELLGFMKEVRFDKLGAFAYSREEGTPAYDFADQIPDNVKETRKKRIMEQQNAISAEKLNESVGRDITVLVDGYDSVNKVYYGRSYMDCPETDGLAFIESNFIESSDKKLTIGEFVRAEIIEALDYDIIARLKE